MKQQRNKKIIFILIIAIFFLNLATITVRAWNDEENAQIYKAKIEATTLANGVSKAELKLIIEELEQEINSKDALPFYSNTLQQAIDKAKLEVYKEVYNNGGSTLITPPPIPPQEPIITAPTTNPTTNPTIGPTTNPTLNPTTNPTASPTTTPIYENNRPVTEPIKDPISDPSTYKPSDNSGATEKTANIIGVLVGGVRAVGTVVAVIALTILGIKYMFGTTENKAKYKESMIPYIIGVVMLAVTINILGMLYNVFSDMF